VAVLDATTHTLHREIVTGTYPIGITIDPAGRVYIANAGYVQHGGSTVTRITTDPVTQMPTAYTTMDNPYFTGVQYAATSPDGGYVYLSKGDGSIVGLNMETDRLDRYGWTGLGDAGSIAVSPNSQWLYIAARTKDFAKTGIVVADSRALDRLPHTFIPLPLVVDDLIVAPTGNKLYAVANAYKTGENGHALYVIDTRSNTVVQTQLLPGNVTGLALLP
jgi:sugar lactone lactonase YvrE